MASSHTELYNLVGANPKQTHASHNYGCHKWCDGKYRV